MTLLGDVEAAEPLVELADLEELLAHSSGASSLLSATRRLARAARLLNLLRHALPGISEPRVALEALQAGLALETDVYTAGNTLVTHFGRLSRRARLELLEHRGEFHEA